METVTVSQIPASHISKMLMHLDHIVVVSRTNELCSWSSCSVWKAEITYWISKDRRFGMHGRNFVRLTGYERRNISSSWGLRKPHALRQAQEIVLSLDQELCQRLWCRTSRRWHFRHIVLALVIVMDGRDVNADQPCHFALQNMLSKTADQQNHSASVGLDFDIYPVLEHFGQGTTKAYTCIFFFWLDVHKVIKGFLVSSLDWLPDGQV